MRAVNIQERPKKDGQEENIDEKPYYDCFRGNGHFVVNNGFCGVFEPFHARRACFVHSCRRNVRHFRGDFALFREDNPKCKQIGGKYR